jgi:hypothetical protein
MAARKIERPKSQLTGVNLLFRVWCEAAEEWQRLQSGAAAARCPAARREYYMASEGRVPALRRTTQEEATA